MPSPENSTVFPVQLRVGECHCVKEFPRGGQWSEPTAVEGERCAETPGSWGIDQQCLVQSPGAAQQSVEDTSLG